MIYQIYFSNICFQIPFFFEPNHGTVVKAAVGKDDEEPIVWPQYLLDKYSETHSANK